MPFADPEAQRLYDKRKYRRNRAKRLRQVKAYNAKHRTKVAQYQRRYGKRRRPELTVYFRQWRREKQSLESKRKERKAQREWHKKNPEKAKARVKRYNRKNRLQFIAHTMIRAALHCGFIVKPKKCSSCGKAHPKRGIHGHHPDYSKPLEVVWLCHPCHLKAHNGSFHNAPISITP